MDQLHYRVEMSRPYNIFTNCDLTTTFYIDAISSHISMTQSVSRDGSLQIAVRQAWLPPLSICIKPASGIQNSTFKSQGYLTAMVAALAPWRTM